MITIFRDGYKEHSTISCLPIFIVSADEIRYNFIDDYNYICIAGKDTYNKRFFRERNVNFYAIEAVSYFCT